MAFLAARGWLSIRGVWYDPLRGGSIRDEMARREDKSREVTGWREIDQENLVLGMVEREVGRGGWGYYTMTDKVSMLARKRGHFDYSGPGLQQRHQSRLEERQR